ncbi:hypothetical protein ACS0TY_015196 [Phlomoides rotata]
MEIDAAPRTSMWLRNTSLNEDPPPIYEAFVSKRGFLCYVCKKGLSNIWSLRKFGVNCGFGERVGSNRFFSCVEEGRFEHIEDDASFKTVVQNVLMGNRELHIYFVTDEGDGVDGVGQGVEGGVSQGVEGGEGSEENEGSDDSDYMDEIEDEEEEEDESDGVEDESSCEDDGIDVDGSGESDVNESEDDFNSQKASDSENEGEVCPIFNPKHMYTPDIKLKMIFNNKWEFIDAVHSDSVLKKRDIYLAKNCKERVYARCKGEGCKWRVHANKVPNEPSFQVRRCNYTHTCPEAYHINSMRSKWLCGRGEHNKPPSLQGKKNGPNRLHWEF